VTLVVAAENYLVAFEPPLEPVTGGANRDDRASGQAVLLDAFELFAADPEPTREEQRYITVVQCFQTGQVAETRRFKKRAPRVVPIL
jgi:hypothetical protein